MHLIVVHYVILTSQAGRSTTVPLADQTVKMWICQFIPCHVWMYFIPHAILTDVFLGTRSTQSQTSKSIPMKCPSLPVQPATTGPLPIKLSSHIRACKSERATLLVNTATEKSAFQQVDLPGGTNVVRRPWWLG